MNQTLSQAQSTPALCQQLLKGRTTREWNLYILKNLGFKQRTIAQVANQKKIKEKHNGKIPLSQILIRLPTVDNYGLECKLSVAIFFINHRNSFMKFLRNFTVQTGTSAEKVTCYLHILNHVN